MDNLVIGAGVHRTRDQGVCVMEAVAWFAGEAHSDAPQCACPVVAALARRLNDRLGDEQRQRLKDLIPRLALSRASWPVTLKRAFIAADFAVRDAAPRALESRGLTRRAAALRALPEIVDRESALRGETAARAAYAANAAVDAAAYAADAGALVAADAVACAANAAAYAADAGALSVIDDRRLADDGIALLGRMLAVTA